MDENSDNQINQDVKNENQGFLNKLSLCSSNEEKIKESLKEMKKALSKDDKPDFKTFWEIKNICLDLFKESLNASLRVDFWKEYVELSNEVKKLKNILHEQTNFEVEQIDLAIIALENELEKYDEILKTIDEIHINEKIKIFLQKKDFLKTQKELNLLNAFAIRISSLRKEIIKTQMHISCKNKFLKRLNILGNIVFPKRKELICVISEEFSNIINIFTEKTFDLKKVQFYVLKEEIKAFQDIAKKITLNTFTFTNCRLKLSKCWDKVKIAEKNYKKEKVQFKDSINSVLEKIKNLKSLYENNPQEHILEKEEKEIYNCMKTLSLRKEDIKFLKHKIKEVKSPIYKKEKTIKEQKIKKENEYENIRKEKLQNIKNTINSILENPNLSLEELTQEKNQIEKELEAINPNKFERLILAKEFRSFFYLIEDKKDKININSNEIKDILAIFDQKKHRRQEIKNHLDNLNKELAGSGFDFEKAMLYRDLIDSEKKRLEAIDSSIEKLEEKLAELESN